MSFRAPKRVIAGVVAALLLGVAMVGFGQGAHSKHMPRVPKREAKDQIEDLEAQFAKAQLAGDAAAMDKLLSDDYLGINSNGEVSTKTQQLDHIRMRRLVVTSAKTLDSKIKVAGQIAIVTSLVELEGTLDGAVLRGNYRYTRVYQRGPNNVWKITNFEATRSKRTQPDA